MPDETIPPTPPVTPNPLQAQLDALNAQFITERENSGKFAAQIADRDTSISSLNSQISTLTNQASSLNSQTSSLTSENTSLKSQVTQLQGRVQQLGDELASRIQQSAGSIDSDPAKMAAAILVLSDTNAKLEKVVMIYANDNSIISTYYKEAIEGARTRLSLPSIGTGYNYHDATQARVDLANTSANTQNVGTIIGAAVKFASILLA